MKKILKAIISAVLLSILLTQTVFSSSAVYSYLAVNYARSHANVTSASSMFDYFPGADCTNYVSQCLFAGKLPMSTVPSNAGWGDNKETTRWYHDSGTRTTGIWPFRKTFTDYKYSTTWTLVYKTNKNAGGLYQYLVDEKGISMTRVTTLSQAIQYAKAGDVIQLILNGETEPHHSVIVTENTGSDLKICAHTTNRLDESFKNICMPGHRAFLIIHTGY